jgi:hypothetical protein
MINRYFTVDAPRSDAMHAEPIAALDALKLVSLAVTRGTSIYLALRAALQLRKTAVLPFCQSTQSPRYGQISLKRLPERRETTLRRTRFLKVPIARDPYENCGLSRFRR